MKNRITKYRRLQHCRGAVLRTSYFVLILWGCLCLNKTYAAEYGASNTDTSRLSSTDQARDWLRLHSNPDPSLYWPNVKPAELIQNLNRYVEDPLLAFESKNTNFCGYTALSFVTLQRDPLGFVQFIMALYQDGKAKMGKVDFEPGERVRMAAGKLKYKGTLDINPATQMWFLSLADHFKGYLNFFNKRFHEGDENTMWASTNFAKFNRMLRKLYGLKVRAKGADLIGPRFDDIYTYLLEASKKGDMVFLYLNNRLLYKKRHVTVRIGMPTHFVLLQNISRDEGYIDIKYMDNTKRTLQQLSPDFLRKILYGVSICTYE
jgi:hypothetical protein